jgi:hypothetical protein
MNNIHWRLFLDDERFPVENDWKIARSSAAAREQVSRYGMPIEIAFDHDLGGEDTSRVFIRWLSDYMIDNNLKFPRYFRFSIHSQNPIGADWIENYMNRLISHIGIK